MQDACLKEEEQSAIRKEEDGIYVLLPGQTDFEADRQTYHPKSQEAYVH
jgi:hypothetical protein